MDPKFLVLLSICLTVAVDSTFGITIRPLAFTRATPPPVQEPKFIQCTQYAGKDYWFSWSGHQYCYHFSTYTSEGFDYMDTWQGAVDQCRKKKASLASIHDFNTNYILTHPLVMPATAYPGYFWIGMSSINSTNRAIYKWSDGTATDYSGNVSTTDANGMKLDPNYLNQGRCMATYLYPQNNFYYKYYGAKLGLWYKTNCGDRHYYICRRDSDPNSTPSPPPLTTPGGCPQGWYKYKDEKCIRYYSTPGNFTQGQKTCAQTPGADMLSIHSQIEQDFVSTLTYGLSSPYIGLSRSFYYYQWKWDDQSAVDFSNWGFQSGSNTYYYYWNCATLVTNMSQPGMWLRTNCSDARPVLCQIPQQDPSIDTGRTLADNRCKISGFGNYVQFRNSCYSVVDTKVGFSDAEQSCQKAGAHLVSIVDAYEESFLRYYLWKNGKLNRYWIGLQSQVESTTDDVVNASQVFEWTDKWPVYYTHWAEQEPKTLEEPQDQCVSMGRLTGNWLTDQCDNLKPYICKVSQDKPPEDEAARNGYCPTLNDNTDPSLNWVNLHKGTPFCYWFSTERKGLRGTAGLASYSDARFHCQRRNGTLVSIHSPHQMNLITTRLAKTTNGFISWIGLSRNPSGEFVWEDSSPVDFLNGLPIDDLANMTDLNDDSGLLCAKLMYDNSWQWGSCVSQERHYFVCQTPKLYASSSDSGSSGKTAGIVIGVLLAIAAVAGVLYYMRRSNMKMPAMPSFDNPLSRGQRTTGIKPQKFDNNSPNDLTNGTHENPFRDEQRPQD